MTECAICLDGIYPAKYMLPCNHLFHVNCIKHWFRTCGFEPSCPICRYKINNFYLCKRKIHLNKSNPTFIKLGEYKIYLKEFGRYMCVQGIWNADGQFYCFVSICIVVVNFVYIIL